MKKELAKFEDWPFRVPSLSGFKKKIELLTKEFVGASSADEALNIFRKVSKLSDKIGDDITHIQVLFSLETQNPKYQKAMSKINNMIPLINLESQSFVKAFLASKYRKELEEKLGKHLFTIYEYSLKGFDERVVSLAQKENELTMKYDAAIASIKVPFRDKFYNLPQMGKFLSDENREVRNEAAKAYYGTLETKKDELENIYSELVLLRDEMAKKLGYKNFIELAYIRMNRFDYTPEMVASYRKQINDVATPLVTKIVKEQLKRIGITKPNITDLNMTFKDGNPLPKGNTKDKIEAAKKMYDALSPDTSYFFRFMDEHHLLFLEAKEGKQSGGYMTYFPVHKCPIIFSNFNGTSGDVDVLTHEFGHSFQAYMARSIKVPEYRMPTMESCEIDSMSMEFFAETYMDLFFDQPDKYRYKHLADSICFLPYGATVDEFQHWVYEHPTATSEERDTYWHELEKKYTPMKVLAEQDCPYLYSGHRWLTQAHIFDSPFYYIDYTLAQVLAFQFFNLDRKNHEKAWKKYLKLCKLGGKYPFCELIKKVGLKVPFEEGVIKKTLAPYKKLLASYKID